MTKLHHHLELQFSITYEDLVFIQDMNPSVIDLHDTDLSLYLSAVYLTVNLSTVYIEDLPNVDRTIDLLCVNLIETLY